MVAALCRSAQPGGIDQLDEGGWGCLHHAASLGAVPHAEALLDAGADATLKSSASSGRYPKGMSPIGVAKQVQRTGLGDRTRVLHSLLLAAQAKGWGEWRELARADAARTDGRVPHTAPSTAAAVTSPEDAVRSKMRAELSIRDQRFKHAELEVQRLTERVQVAEKRMKASSLRADRLGARCQALEKQSQAQEMQLPVLQLALDEAFSRAVAAEHASATSLAALQRTQQEGAAQLKAAAAATEAALAAAAIVTEQRRQHSTGTKALLRMAQLALGRAWGGWTYCLRLRQRQQRLLRRGVGRMDRRGMGLSLESWVAYTTEAQRQRQHATSLQIAEQSVAMLAQAERRRDTATKAAVRMSAYTLGKSFDSWRASNQALQRRRRLLRRAIARVAALHLRGMYGRWADGTSRARAQAESEAAARSATETERQLRERQATITQLRVQLASCQGELGGNDAQVIHLRHALLRAQQGAEEARTATAAASTAMEEEQRLAQRLMNLMDRLKADLLASQKEVASMHRTFSKERAQLEGAVAAASREEAAARRVAADTLTDQRSVATALATAERTQHYYARQLAMLSRLLPSVPTAIRRVGSLDECADVTNVSELNPPSTEQLLHLALRQDMHSFIRSYIQSAGLSGCSLEAWQAWQAKSQFGTLSSSASAPALAPWRQRRGPGTRQRGGNGSALVCASDTAADQWDWAPGAPDNTPINKQGVHNMGPLPVVAAVCDGIHSDSLRSDDVPTGSSSIDMRSCGSTSPPRPRTRDRAPLPLEAAIEAAWAIEWAEAHAHEQKVSRLTQQNLRLKQQLRTGQAAIQPRRHAQLSPTTATGLGPSLVAALADTRMYGTRDVAHKAAQLRARMAAIQRA
jgi:hypothetical protein